MQHIGANADHVSSNVFYISHYYQLPGFENNKAHPFATRSPQSSSMNQMTQNHFFSPSKFFDFAPNKPSASPIYRTPVGNKSGKFRSLALQKSPHKISSFDAYIPTRHDSLDEEAKDDSKLKDFLEETQQFPSKIEIENAINIKIEDGTEKQKNVEKAVAHVLNNLNSGLDLSQTKVNQFKMFGNVQSNRFIPLKASSKNEFVILIFRS